MTLYTIPPDMNFLDALAAGVMKDSERTNISLPSYKILLPNRRSCQGLRDAFLDLSDGAIMLLPQIRSIGEVEEEELLLSGHADIIEKLMAVPPAISNYRRQFMLMRLIRQMDRQTQHNRSMDQALSLAGALGILLDQVIIEEISFENLAQIVPEEFADHWQITLDFLDILKTAWPQILQEHGVIEAAARRNQLLDIQSDFWREQPPKGPIIAAGSTGTMPATARLMAVIHGLPSGSVVLPGLDTHLDEESWKVLDAAHPQSLFKELLDEIGAARTDVRLWNVKEKTDFVSARQHLAREMMRPSETTHLWRDVPDSETLNDITKDLSHIKICECSSPRSEAMVIALKLRAALETKQQNAALVTPDRSLANQVRLICKRWGIELDDTGGRTLLETSLGQFLILSLPLMAHQPPSPSALLALLKHSLCMLGMNSDSRTLQISQIDQVLRGPAPKNVWDTLAEFDLIHTLKAAIDKSRPKSEEITYDAKQLIHNHLELMEKMTCTPTEDGSVRLWHGEEGEQAATFFHELLQEADVLGEISLNEYAEILNILLRKIIIRPKYGMHPRLLVMGQIEARLIKADVMVLGGLNEGTWPALPQTDPWMSRPMRTAFGLPALERSIALSAHDFTQAFCAKDVFITRSLKQDGAPSVPARWLARLDTVLGAYGVTPEDLRDTYYNHLAVQLDKPSMSVQHALRPRPTPILSRRPKSLPVTAIETWMRDPYSLYAKYVLRLRKWQDIEQESDVAQRGSWLHNVFEWFVRSYPKQIPEDAAQLMIQHASSHPDALQEIDMFMPRLERLIDWFITHETKWRTLADVNPQALEIKGKMEVGDGFYLTAKADRIDTWKDSGHAAIIDYKTGRIPSGRDVVMGLAPQMPLEGAIVNHQGFEGVRSAYVHSLRFWKMNGVSDGGEEKEIKGRGVPEIQELIEDTMLGLESLITEFQNSDVPYISLPDPSAAPPEDWQDYAQLARMQEWRALDEGEN